MSRPRSPDGIHLNPLRYSILPAITIDGMIYCTIVEGSFNSALFYDFVTSLLEHMNPWPARNSVIVMDNCAIHKVPEVRELIESRYVCHICYQLLLIRRDLGE